MTKHRGPPLPEYHDRQARVRWVSLSLEHQGGSLQFLSSMSLELTRVSYPKASKSGLFRKEIQASEKIITERAYLQIWTNYDFTDETDRETDFDINLVILTSDRIWDVECESLVANVGSCVLITSYFSGKDS